MDTIQKKLLETVVGLHKIPTGAFSIRSDGKEIAGRSTDHIEIIPKKSGNGLDIYIKPEVRHETVHIPVIMSQSGLKETIHYDFHVAAGADVIIISGCGIHNAGSLDSIHNGIHHFYIEENAHAKYIENHYGQGDGVGKRILNPKTLIELEKNSSMEMESVQIKGVDSTKRETTAVLADGAKFRVTERLMTHGLQKADSIFEVTMDGSHASADIVSRSVARNQSSQTFISRLKGNAPCVGHSECDSIIMDQAHISSLPEIEANCLDATLIHEAAIGKIAGEQLIKLMTFGMTEKQAEEQIVNGFLH